MSASHFLHLSLPCYLAESQQITLICYPCVFQDTVRDGDQIDRCYTKGPYVQRRVNIAGLPCLTWKRLQGWPLAGVWELRFQEGSHPLTDKWGSLCQTVCTNSVVYGKHVLSFWEPGIGIDRVLCDQSPGKPLGTASLMDFPGWQHSICFVPYSNIPYVLSLSLSIVIVHMYCHSLLLEEFSVLCDSSGRGLLEADARLHLIHLFLLLFLLCIFSL